MHTEISYCYVKDCEQHATHTGFGWEFCDQHSARQGFCEGCGTFCGINEEWAKTVALCPTCQAELLAQETHHDEDDSMGEIYRQMEEERLRPQADVHLEEDS